MSNLIQKQKEFMKTTITVKVVQTDQRTVDILDAIEEAFGEFDRIVKKFTRFDDNSELSNLNRQSGSWVEITDEFFMLIEYMVQMSKDTNCAFDPTVIDFLETYGYDKNYDFSKLDNKELDSLVEKISKKRPSPLDIELDETKKAVKLQKNQRIDLGGVGKGYAIDCAFDKLNALGCDFLIDAGGDIRAKGMNEKNKLWTVDLKSKNRTVGTIQLNNQALASSGSWARKVKQFHHLLDPKSGKPIERDYDTVFVKANIAMQADAWATALFINPDLQQNDLDLEVLFD